MLERAPREFRIRWRVQHALLGPGTLKQQMSPFVWQVRFDTGETHLVRDEALQRRDPNSRWPSRHPAIIHCRVCGNPRRVAPSRLKSSHYCSRRCLYIGLIGHNVKEENIQKLLDWNKRQPIPARAQAHLKHAGVTLGQAAMLRDKQLRVMYGFGPKSLAALKRWSASAACLLPRSGGIRALL